MRFERAYPLMELDEVREVVILPAPQGAYLSVAHRSPPRAAVHTHASIRGQGFYG